jgi:predicted dehydrogenase
VGEENNLRLRVFGTRGALDWSHGDPNRLTVRYADRPEETYLRGNPYLAPAARHASRLPSGHFEGYLGAFASLYGNIVRTIAARAAGEAPDPLDLDFPTAQDGARGVHFIHAALRSGHEERWVDASYTPPPGA